MDDVPRKPTPADWIEALDRAEADVAAGRVVDSETLHRELRAGIEDASRVGRERERGTGG